MSGRLLSELTGTMTLPVIVAPMFLISGPDLVIASAKAGLIGAFPAANARTIDDLSAWLSKIASSLDSADLKCNWAINLIVHSSYDRFDAEMDLVERLCPPLIITALGSPKRVLERAGRLGAAVFSDVIDPRQARKAVDAGADGLVLVCSGAGGHTGEYSPFAFIDEVRRFWDGPLVAAGAVSSARSIAAMLMAGADLVYMGTRFICCRESLVSNDYRNMIIRAGMTDIVTTASISGVKGNWLRESLERSGFEFEDISARGKIDFSNIQGETKAWKNIWSAGQGVGAAEKIQSVDELVRDLCSEWNNAPPASVIVDTWRSRCAPA